MVEELIVDTSRGSKLKINFDIIVHQISCDFLSLGKLFQTHFPIESFWKWVSLLADALDVSGVQHIGIEHNVYKRRLDLNGKPIEDPVKEQHVGEKVKIMNKTETSEVVTCGSCYGAESPEMKCCNSCDDVKKAYSRKTWKFDPRGIEQCKGQEITSEAEARALKEGCHMYGYLEVSRVGGSFHLAPGRSYSINHMHVHDVQPFMSGDFNLTHTIRHLSFGQKVDSLEAPLDNLKSTAEAGSTMFQYYLKIVPTTYVKKDNSVFLTNQFSVTRHSKVISLLSGESGMPGIFFSYELAPFMVKYSEKEKSFGHFATGLCAILGGIFTVAGILDKLVYSSSKIIQKKIELGKATWLSSCHNLSKLCFYPDQVLFLWFHSFSLTRVQ